MNHRARKLIIVGIVICLIGSVFEVSFVSFDGWISNSLGSNRALGIWLADVVVATVRFGVAPFGAALAAIGTALHWFRGNVSTGSGHEDDERGVGGSFGSD